MLDISMDYVPGVEELWLAAYYGDAPKLSGLLANEEYRARINHRMGSHKGHSPVFFACYGAANPETLRLLLDAGADPFQRDNIGRLPLHYAANSLAKEIIDVLLEVPNMKAHRLDANANIRQTPLQAMFLPSLGVSLAKRGDNSKISPCLDSMLDPDKIASKKAMEQVDENGLNSFMLVKHYKLNSSFPPQHTPPRAFEMFLKNLIREPGNITDILKSEMYVNTQSSEPVISIEESIALFAETQKAQECSIVPALVPEQDEADLVEATKNKLKVF